ncbi:hypothetical protein [Stutzerimonas stutzeri]|uniref:hypothetical protein n=1 Tax=Stutzerimonas stutzeri TaxID=316 RepID=UPI001BCC5FC3|nr:hypothetical protein [Stutzerimonas stutzeri]
MRIYPCIAALMMILIMVVSGLPNWGTFSWCKGLAAGAATAFVWHASKPMSKALGFVGIALLVAVSLGFGSDLTQGSKIFFNGMSVGVIVGAAISVWWRWDRFRPRLVEQARREDVKWLLRMLGEQS